MIDRLFSFFTSKEFLLFIMVGGFAALVNFLSRILYSEYVGFSLAIFFAYITGMITAFVLNKMFVFEESSNSTGHEVFYFTLVNLAAVLQTWLVSMALYHYVLMWLGVERYTMGIAHLAGVLVPVFSSYVGHKYLTFKS